MNMETRIFGRKYIAKWMLKWLKDRRGFITRFNKQYRSKSKHVSHVQQDFTRSLDPFRLCRSLCILCSTLSISFTASECSGIERVRILMPMAHDERKSWRVCSLQLCLDAIWLQCSTIITWAYRGWRKSFRYDWFSATLPTSCFFRASFQICYDGRPWNAHGKHRLVDPAFLIIPQPRDQCHKGAPPATELQRRACLSSPPAKSGTKILPASEVRSIHFPLTRLLAGMHWNKKITETTYSLTCKQTKRNDGGRLRITQHI